MREFFKTTLFGVVMAVILTTAAYWQEIFVKATDMLMAIY